MPVHCKEFDSCGCPPPQFLHTPTPGIRMGFGDTSGARVSLCVSLNIYSKTKQGWGRSRGRLCLAVLCSHCKNEAKQRGTQN